MFHNNAQAKMYTLYNGKIFVSLGISILMCIKRFVYMGEGLDFVGQLKVSQNFGSNIWKIESKMDLVNVGTLSRKKSDSILVLGYF